MQPRAQPVPVRSRDKCRRGTLFERRRDKQRRRSEAEPRPSLGRGRDAEQSRAAFVFSPYSGSPGRAKAGSEAAKQPTAGNRAAFTSLGRQARQPWKAEQTQSSRQRHVLRKAAKEGQKGTQKGHKAGRPGKCTGRRPKAPEKAPEGPKKQNTAGSRKRSSADGSRAGPRQPVRVARVAIALPFCQVEISPQTEQPRRAAGPRANEF